MKTQQGLIGVYLLIGMTGAQILNHFKQVKNLLFVVYSYFHTPYHVLLNRNLHYPTDGHVKSSKLPNVIICQEAFMNAKSSNHALN